MGLVDTQQLYRPISARVNSLKRRQQLRHKCSADNCWLSRALKKCSKSYTGTHYKADDHRYKITVKFLMYVLESGCVACINIL
ncbi:MAG: hypothetical protein ACI80S_001973 [Pseudohongiellaceae bacterium]